MSIEDKKNQMIHLETDENETVDFCVIEQTKLNGINYLLVTEQSSDNAQDDEEVAYILKDISAEDDEEAVYDIVEDEQELESIGALFAELLEDTEIKY